VQRVYGPAVTGYDRHNGVVRTVHTDAGDVTVDEAVVVAVGAWMPKHWEWLGRAPKLPVAYPDGVFEEAMNMWTFWRLLEGEVYLPDDVHFRTADGKDSPVLHVELMNTPVVDAGGREIKEYVYWYTRYAAERVGAPGVQGGTIPVRMGSEAELEPYGHLNDRYQADDWFADYYCATAGQLFGRFEKLRPYFKKRRNGGIGAFTPDNVPVFDWIADNAFMTADSNHGFKMIGVGKLVAHLLAKGETPDELKPFALRRYAEGWTYGGRNSNCPWV
jgi:glycine/D-amino acid oxidase-like deaminating enzyme